jgi:hypothetical protein
VRVHGMASRPHVQGNSAPLKLRCSGGDLTDGAGLLPVRRFWDRLGLSERIDRVATGLSGLFRPRLLVELWVVLLLYGGGSREDLRWLGGRRIRRLFGWSKVPDPPTSGRFLRRGGEAFAELICRLPWHVVRARWAAVGVVRDFARAEHSPTPRQLRQVESCAILVETLLRATPALGCN